MTHNYDNTLSKKQINTKHIRNFKNLKICIKLKNLRSNFGFLNE